MWLAQEIHTRGSFAFIIYKYITHGMNIRGIFFDSLSSDNDTGLNYIWSLQRKHIVTYQNQNVFFVMNIISNPNEWSMNYGLQIYFTAGKTDIQDLVEDY